jgi:hypothetical protein
MALDIDQTLFDRDGTRGRSGYWYWLSARALIRLNPLFARFRTDLSRAEIAFEPDLRRSVTSGNRVRFGDDLLGTSWVSQAHTLVHELVHVAQAQLLGEAGMIGRGIRDLCRSGPGERHYLVSPELAAQTMETLDIVDARYDLEALADQFADLTLKTNIRWIFRH